MRVPEASSAVSRRSDRTLPHCRHSLVIGGTGMLREVSVALARHSDVLTSVARTARSLQALDARVRRVCTHHMLQLDWNQQTSFLDGLERHVQAAGVPQRMLLWLHQDALADALMECLERLATPYRVFQVRGSAAANPAFRDARPSMNGVGRVYASYRQIVLGFHLQDTRSRWLHDDEIVRGVIEAMVADRERSIVGTIEPWSRRP
jgi:hypothetical protein